MIGDSEFFLNELIDPMLHRRCYTAIHLRLSAAWKATQQVTTWSLTSMTNSEGRAHRPSQIPFRMLVRIWILNIFWLVWLAGGPWCWKLLIRAKLTLPATASWCVAWWGEVLVCLCRVHCFTSEQYYRPGSNRKLLCARKGQGCTFGKMKWTRIVDVTRN